MAIVDPANVRNVGILGHSSTGKTMLIEHILHLAGKTNRLGKIEDGNTVGDYLQEEIDRQQTICMKLMNLEWAGKRIHLVDHPGYADFVGEIAASVPVLDSVIIVVDATSPIQVGTDVAMKYADKHDTPRAIFVNKLDREHTSFDEVVAAIQATYGQQCVPFVLPIGHSDSLSGAVNILTEQNDELAGRIEELKASMIDVVAESDDALLEKFLESGELTPDEFNLGLQKGIQAGKIVPIIGGSVSKEVGLKHLMDLVATIFPSPCDRKITATARGDEEKVIEPSKDAPFLAQVFRSIVDPYVGQLTFFRVFAGTLRSDTDFYNVSTRSKERTGKLYLMNGKEQTPVDSVGPGDLAAMTKLKNTHFSDTIAAAGTELTLPAIALPESMVKLAISPKSRADEDKIGEALNRMAEEDPTFTHYRDTATNEHVIRGMGDLQLDILLERMKRKFNVEAETRTPKVAYKETVRG
ncbi:MAG TPA: GTP-binding protein, partial [Candidatus Hydrogenedentes bacterium]|nr:GTP-binding protein [Candidatus Hydrogenedentota bacterium]